MILQEINLYQDRFKEKKIVLSALQLMLLTGLCIILLGGSSFWYEHQYQLVWQQNKSNLEQKEQSAQQLETLRKSLESLLANNQFEKEIVKTSTDISVRKRIIDFMANNQFGSGEGFSSNLSTLSEIKIDDVWLSEITLDGEYIKLSGSALRAEKVPEYFNQFRQHRLFNGKVFEVFELDRVKEQDWKVDFLIASRAATNE